MYLKSEALRPPRFLVIGRLQNRCVDALLFWPTGKYMIHCIRGDQILHIHVQCMVHVAKRGLKNSGKCSYPCVKKSFKTQHGRIQIDPAILAAIGHRFNS